MANNNKRPAWAPHAVATAAGWVDPRTGEVLVSCKGLKVDVKERYEEELNVAATQSAIELLENVAKVADKAYQMLDEPATEAATEPKKPVKKKTTTRKRRATGANPPPNSRRSVIG